MVLRSRLAPQSADAAGSLPIRLNEPNPGRLQLADSCGQHCLLVVTKPGVQHMMDSGIVHVEQSSQTFQVPCEKCSHDQGGVPPVQPVHVSIQRPALQAIVLHVYVIYSAAVNSSGEQGGVPGVGNVAWADMLAELAQLVAMASTCVYPQKIVCTEWVPLRRLQHPIKFLMGDPRVSSYTVLRKTSFERVNPKVEKSLVEYLLRPG
mmetsp:Transcript_6616/g.14271  ORF Transcript_6616/g.14271 Transcript_6616/m.14271 type:complete len:206 (+) Transcript_6616:258-875(+)